MQVEMLPQFLKVCALINYSILLVWFAAFWFAHDAMYRLHARWFPMPVEHFNAIHYISMAVYKIGILLFCLVPYLALRFIG